MAYPHPKKQNKKQDKKQDKKKLCDFPKQTLQLPSESCHMSLFHRTLDNH